MLFRSKSVFVKKQVRYAVSAAATADELLAELEAELTRLAGTEDRVLDTTLLIHPKAMVDFLDYHFFLAEAEALIQDALYGVMQGKTVIAIAHRLSTIAQMDRIVVLEDGRVAEQGSHAELLAKGGLYARFWARQSGGFIGLEDAAE